MLLGGRESAHAHQAEPTRTTVDIANESSIPSYSPNNPTAATPFSSTGPRAR